MGIRNFNVDMDEENENLQTYFISKSLLEYDRSEIQIQNQSVSQHNFRKTFRKTQQNVHKTLLEFIKKN